jgi:hypothetical protein
MLLGLVAFLQENPVGVIILVGFAFNVHHLLNDLLRALSMERGTRKHEQGHPNHGATSFGHRSYLCISKVTSF